MERFCIDFKKNVSSEDHSFFLDIMDSSRFKYYGKVTANSIFIREKLTISKPKTFLIAKGDILEINNQTRLNLRIRSFYPIQVFIFVLGLIFLIYLLYLAFTLENGLGLLLIIVPLFYCGLFIHFIK